MTPNSPSPIALFTAVSTLCKVLGTVLAAHGLGSSGTYMWVQLVGGSVMVLGPAVWEVGAQALALVQTRAVGVQAGINLTVSGHALDTNGTVVSSNIGSTPPLPVTLATATKIVADFGPEASSIAKV